MDNRWKTSPGCVYNMSYHIIWRPKYRRKVLINGIDERLKVILADIATRMVGKLERWKSCPTMYIYF